MAEPENVIQGENQEKILENPENAVPGDFKMPSADELLKMLDSLNMSDADKEDLRNSLLSRQGAGGAAAVGSNYAGLIIMLIMVSIITSIFVYFGYKIYRSMTEKDRKRAEKLKLKEERKKKK